MATTTFNLWAGLTVRLTSRWCWGNGIISESILGAGGEDKVEMDGVDSKDVSSPSGVDPS